MITLSLRVEATTNLEKILGSGRNRDGSPGRNAFRQISTVLTTQSLFFRYWRKSAKKAWKIAEGEKKCLRLSVCDRSLVRLMIFI